MYWCYLRSRYISSEVPPIALVGALVAIAVTLGTVKVCSGKTAAERPKVGSLKGQVGITKSNGEIVSPESATVYVLFSSAMTPGFIGSFSHAIDFSTAGGQFREHLRVLLDKNKDLKNLTKSARENPRPEVANQIGAYHLQSVDEALTQVRAWLTKHQDRTWQMKTLAPDGQGFWSIDGLQPGEYEVVVRGKFSVYDADWEGTVDLTPGTTINLPLTQPRFVRHE